MKKRWRNGIIPKVRKDKNWDIVLSLYFNYYIDNELQKIVYVRETVEKVVIPISIIQNISSFGNYKYHFREIIEQYIIQNSKKISTINDFITRNYIIEQTINKISELLNTSTS